MSLLEIFTVYDHPDDFPDSFVVRRAVIGPGVALQDAEPLKVGSLDEVREALPPGLIRLDRDPTDPPAILEVWL